MAGGEITASISLYEREGLNGRGNAYIVAEDGIAHGFDGKWALCFGRF